MMRKKLKKLWCFEDGTRIFVLASFVFHLGLRHPVKGSNQRAKQVYPLIMRIEYSQRSSETVHLEPMRFYNVRRSRFLLAALGLARPQDFFVTILGVKLRFPEV